MKNLKFKIIILVSLLVITFYSLINFIIGTEYLKPLKNKISPEVVYNIKKYLFPIKLISELEKKILEQNVHLSLELDYISNLHDLMRIGITKLELENNLILEKNTMSGLYFGIDKESPGSAYLDFDNENLIIVSTRGMVAFNDIAQNNFEFKQIRNNINSFLSLDKVAKNPSYRGVGIRDLMINESVIYLSFIDEISENCWNISLLRADVNYKYLNFEKFFSSEECIVRPNNKEKDFNINQSGGRIVSYHKNKLLLSVGEFRSRSLAQNLNSINGKVLSIDLKNGKREIVSMGHRNPQGMVFDEEKNIILLTEHGPLGGDEFNLVDLNSKSLKNFGWPISSYGEHYGEKYLNKKKYLEFPLYKSHSEYNFIEPLKYFTPSIAPSEIVKTKNNFYIASSMKDKSIYFFQLNEKNKIINFKRIEIGERIRDLKLKNDKLYLFLEDTASIGVISF